MVNPNLLTITIIAKLHSQFTQVVPIKMLKVNTTRIFITCSFWGRTVAYLAELQSIYSNLKGRVAMVSGHMESYKNGEGQKCWTLKAERIVISPRPSKTNGNPDDELPF